MLRERDCHRDRNRCDKDEKPVVCRRPRFLRTLLWILLIILLIPFLGPCCSLALIGWLMFRMWHRGSCRA